MRKRRDSLGNTRRTTVQLMELPLWLIEDVTWPVLWGLLAIGVLGTTWFVTRRFAFLVAALICVGLLVLAVVIEKRVVTDKEQLVHTIYVLAGHVQNNNAAGILQHVDDKNVALQSRIRQNMARYDFSTCNVVGFSKVQLNPPDTAPRMADVAFSVWATGSETGRIEGLISSSVAVRLEFKKIDGQWVINRYGYVAPANAQRKIIMIGD